MLINCHLSKYTTMILFLGLALLGTENVASVSTLKQPKLMPEKVGKHKLDAYIYWVYFNPEAESRPKGPDGLNEDTQQEAEYQWTMPVKRRLEYTTRPENAAMYALLEEPTASEKALGCESTLHRRQVSFQRIDFSDENQLATVYLRAPQGFSLILRNVEMFYQQIAMTLMQFGHIHRVKIMVNGLDYSNYGGA